jgi:hypothetical protein
MDDLFNDIVLWNVTNLDVRKPEPTISFTIYHPDSEEYKKLYRWFMLDEPWEE